MVQTGGVHHLRAEHLCIRGFESGNINLTLSPGSRVGILGDAGSGKTSLLRTLACLDPSTSGKLFWGKAEVSRKSLWRVKKRRRYVSLLLANPYAYFDQNMRVSAILRDIESDAGKTVTEPLQENKIPVAAISQKVESLSGIMRIHLALMRIQQNQSPVVLIDDVFRYVIPEAWQSVSNVIAETVDGTQALLVASRFYECLRVTDYILVIHQGAFVEGGSREAILSSPAHSITRRLVHRKGRGQTDPMITGSRDLRVGDANSNVEAVSVSPGHWVLPS